MNSVISNAGCVSQVSFLAYAVSVVYKQARVCLSHTVRDRTASILEQLPNVSCLGQSTA